MEPQSGIKAWQWVVTIIVIIVLIIIGIFVFGGKGSETPNPTDTSTPNPTDTTAAALNRIVMSDQYPGNVVYLSSVQVAQPGWAVVQADNKGIPGKVIGTAKLDAGIAPIKVTLTQPTVEGGTYYVVLYNDDGDGKFDSTKDMPLKDANGNVIMKVFHASASVGAGFKG